MQGKFALFNQTPMRRIASLSLLTLLVIPILSFAPGKRRTMEMMRRKWRIDVVRVYTGKPFDAGQDRSAPYQGDEIEFITDSTMRFYDKSEDKTYTGTWEIVDGMGGPHSHGDMLWMKMTDGTRKLNIDAQDFTVSKRKLFYVVPKGKELYWHFWVPVADSAAVE